MPIKNPLLLTEAQVLEIESKLDSNDHVVVTLNGGRTGKKFLVHSVDTYLARRKAARRAGKFSKKA